MFFNKKNRSKKVFSLVVLILLLIGGGVYYYYYASPGILEEELGYIRATSQKNGSYFVTFDNADWLFVEDSLSEDEPASKNITDLKASARVYRFLNNNQSYLNNPVTIFLDDNQTVVKVELIEEASN